MLDALTTAEAQQAAFDDVIEQLSDVTDEQLDAIRRKQLFAVHVFDFFEDRASWSGYTEVDREDINFLQGAHEVALAAMDSEVAVRVALREIDPDIDPMRIF